LLTTNKILAKVTNFDQNKTVAIADAVPGINGTPLKPL